MHLISHLLLSALLILRCNLEELGCGEFKKKISCEERTQILDMHNRIRQAAALGILMRSPISSLDSSSNIIELTWNGRMAKRAESWARKCRFGHDITIGRIWLANPEDTTYRLEMGQHVAFEWSKKKGDKAKWFKPMRYWLSGIYNKRKEGYYRQITWANTSLIGCGIEYFKHPKLNYVKIYVCNYATGAKNYFPTEDLGLLGCSKKDLIPSTTYIGLCQKIHARIEKCKDS